PQAAIAAISGLIPRIFIARVRSRSHSCLHRAERMLDSLATKAHSERVRIEPLLHGVEQVLVLPSRDPSLGPRRALGVVRTILTGVGPAARQDLVGLFVFIAIRHPLAGRTTIGVFLRQIDKVLLTEASV